MRLRKSDHVCGFPAPTMRELFRRAIHNRGHIDRELIANILEISATDADRVLVDLLRSGYIVEQDEAHPRLSPGTYHVTRGGQIANARFSAPIKRDTANSLVSTLPSRIGAINESPDFLHVIRYAFLFGSYVTTDSVSIGDVGLAVEVSEPNLPIFQQMNAMTCTENTFLRMAVQTKTYCSVTVSRLTK